MRVLAILLGLGLAGISSADLVGQWQGIATLGLSIDSKPGLPQTKQVFKKLEPAGAAKPKSKPAKSTGH